MSHAKIFSWNVNGVRSALGKGLGDFIASAEHLIDKKYAAAGNIVAQGGSAGGMLMGAVANMAPEAFAGIIAELPFVDVLATMLDDTLPLTPPEWPEWGNPIASAEDFALALLRDHLGAGGVVTGADFTFGKDLGEHLL